MNKERLLKHLVLLMFFIFIADLLAKTFYWYYTVWWFDIVMHFISGFWVGLFFLYVFYDKNTFFRKFTAVILGVLLIGILWEIFEVYLNVVSLESFSIKDTALDMFFDLAGGLSMMFYYSKRIVGK